MIPYFNPQFGFSGLIRTLLCRKPEEKLTRIFQKVSGKRYILFTASCRSALYLAYKAIDEKGVVHTSPLTCKVALLPILGAGNSIRFHDVKRNDWTLDPDTIESELNEESIAIQAIHLGGYPCDMQSLRNIAHKHNLVLIEDCAQGYGASYDGIPTGRIGDIACYTLTKNLFSLGGGVFATDNKEWYEAAKKEQLEFPYESSMKIAYRVLMALLGTYRKYSFGEKLYQTLKGKPKTIISKDELILLEKELRRPARLYLKSCAARWGKIAELVETRKSEARELLDELAIDSDSIQNNELADSSFTKIFVLSNESSPCAIEKLNESGIEAMHLEHKHKIYYQEKLLHYDSNVDNGSTLEVYNILHDNLLSLPVDKNIVKMKTKIKGKQTLGKRLKNYLIYLGHPSHFYVFRHIIQTLKENNYKVSVVIKTKDVLEDLVKSEGWEYHNISKTRRGSSFYEIAKDVVSRNLSLSKILIFKKIDIILTCGSDIAFLAKIFRIPLFLFNDDDFHIVPKSSTYGWPYVPVVFAPKGCDMGKFNSKTIHYNGFQKSFYLQDNVFESNPNIVKKKISSDRYFLIRVVGLDAHHDDGIKGIGEALLGKIVDILKPHGDIIISSERILTERFEKYQIKIDPIEMHHFIYYADLVVGDSQSMIHEAALMGVPSIRYNSFVGKIGVMNVLEDDYGLSVGIPAGQEEELLETIERVVKDREYKSTIQKRLEIMNESMVDVNQMVLDYLESKGYYKSNS